MDDLIAFAHQLNAQKLLPYQEKMLRYLDAFGKTQIINGLREEFFRKNPSKTLFDISAIRRAGRIELRRIRKQVLFLRKGPNRSQWQRMKDEQL